MGAIGPIFVWFTLSRFERQETDVNLSVCPLIVSGRPCFYDRTSLLHWFKSCQILNYFDAGQMLGHLSFVILRLRL